LNDITAAKRRLDWTVIVSQAINVHRAQPVIIKDTGLGGRIYISIFGANRLTADLTGNQAGVYLQGHFGVVRGRPEDMLSDVI
jgi:hypothetical protein